MLDKCINNRHQTCINLIFICDRLSMTQGQGYSISQKLWTGPRVLCAPNDEIILIGYHLGPNIWKLNKLLMAGPHLLCQMYFSLISALFSSRHAKSQSLLGGEYGSNKGKGASKFWSFLMLPLLKVFLFKNKSVRKD